MVAATVLCGRPLRGFWVVVASAAEVAPGVEAALAAAEDSAVLAEAPLAAAERVAVGEGCPTPWRWSSDLGVVAT